MKRIIPGRSNEDLTKGLPPDFAPGRPEVKGVPGALRFLPSPEIPEAVFQVCLYKVYFCQPGFESRFAEVRMKSHEGILAALFQLCRKAF